MRKSFVTMGLAVALTMATSITALAGWEQTGTTWKYQNADKTYMTSTWNWIDGNGDNIAECYYFGADSIMLSNCITPDNYIVNENGAWTVNGIVQTKIIENSSSTSHSNNTTPSQESQPQNQESQAIWDGSMPGSNSGTPSMDGGNTSNENDSPFRTGPIDTYDPGDIGLGIN